MRYNERAQLTNNQAAKQLLLLMEEKQSNVGLSADVTTSSDLLQLVKAVADKVAVVKTHIDIIDDFTPDVIGELQELQQQYKFSLFEDRKFADIGNTVKKQYGGGIYAIASWADITNAHTVPGPGIIQGLAEVGLPLGRGLLLLAEMSSAGTLAAGDYTKTTIGWANQFPDFVIGFIGMKRLTDNPAHIVMTPGVQFIAAGDTLGQQYQDPSAAIAGGSDVILVGRGIYESTDPYSTAEQYRQAGWSAYLERESN